MLLHNNNNQFHIIRSFDHPLSMHRLEDKPIIINIVER